MFVAGFVAAAFWRGCGQIFVAAASCETKVYVCHQGYRDLLRLIYIEHYGYKRSE